MSFEGTVRVIIFYSIIIISLSEKIRAENTSKYYTLTTDQSEIEEKVFHHVHNQGTLFGLMKNAIVDMLPNVCNVWWTERLNYCRHILKADENEFYLTVREPGDLKCNNVSLLVYFFTRSTLLRSTLPAFFCPPICYEDLETNGQVCLPNTYAVSRTLEHNSISMLVQRDKQSVWYPLLHIANIGFKKIKSSRNSSGSDRTAIHTATEVNDDDNINAYLEAKKLSSPYEKFDRFFSSINVCGLRRAYVAYLCRTSIKEAFVTRKVDFDLLGYNKQACKRYSVSPPDRSDDGHHFQHQNELAMVRCPPIYELSNYISLRNHFDFYYIASNLKSQSTTLFTRRNKKGKLPRQEANIENISMKPITKDIRRWRFLPPAAPTKPEKSYHDIEDELKNSLQKDLRPLSTLDRLDKTSLEEMLPTGGEPKISLNKWLADDSIIAFSKVKMVKHIYQRFKETYGSIDIGQLSMRQKALLCNKALKVYEDPQDIYRILDGEIFQNFRERVRLTRREVDDLQTNIFSLFECPNDKVKFFKRFFVGKNHLKNTATIYKAAQIKEKNYYYAHAFVYDINLYELAYFVKHD